MKQSGPLNNKAGITKQAETYAHGQGVEGAGPEEGLGTR